MSAHRVAVWHRQVEGTHIRGKRGGARML